MPDVYIDTDVAAGGAGTSGDPYGGFEEAWEAEDANLASGETWNFYCRGTAADIVSLLPIDGYASGVTAINIYPWHTEFGAASDADDGWYQGDDNWSTSHYRLVGDNNTYILQFNNTNGAATIRVQGIQLEHTSNSSGHRCVEVEEQSSGAEVIFSGNRFKISGSGGFPRGIRAGNTTASATLTFVNNLLTYAGSNPMSAFNLNDSTFTSRFVNNTVVYSGTGGEDFFDDFGGPTSTAYNNVAYAAGGTGDIEFDNSGTLTSDYNASIVSADRGANGFDVATADFTSYGTGDTNELTPATSQTNAWGAGGETNGDEALIPTTDIRGNARNTGSGAATAIGAFAASGEGAGGATVTGSGAATTAAATASGTAEREITGSGAATTAATTASGTGSVQGTVTGTGAATTAAVTASGVAEREITGTGAATIGAVTASGSGTVGNEITGTGAATIAAITASGTAEREITATGAATTGAVQASGTASRGQDATGAATIAAVTASGTAEREITGTGAATIGAVEASGIGALDGEVTGSGAATVAPVEASGSGVVVSIAPERQPGGWLPTIYVDRDGNEVDLDEKVAEVVAEAKADATKPQRKKIAKVAPEVIAAFRADEFKPTKEMERLAAHLGQVEAKYERMLRDAIEARRRQDEDDEAVALLLIA